MRTIFGILFLAFAGVFSAQTAEARTITAGTRVANPGAAVAVPVTVGDLSDVGAAVVSVGYDPSVVVCLGVEAGAVSVAKDMSYSDTGSGHICVILSDVSQSATGGEIFRMRFSVRSGTAASRRGRRVVCACPLAVGGHEHPFNDDPFAWTFGADGK